MARYKLAAEWLRRKREERGFASRAALARKAGLATSHIATIERGEIRPRSTTEARIARALRLSRQEREEFRRLIAIDGTPRAAKDALTAPQVPDVAVWRYLPRALYDVHHDYQGLVPANPDRVIEVLVPAAASLLAWQAIAAQPPAKRERARLLSLLRTYCTQAPSAKGTRINREVDRLLFGSDAEIVSATLPYLWRRILFSTPQSTRRRVSRLSHWTYATHISLITEDSLTLNFKHKDADASWGVEKVSAELIARLHDALTLHRFWFELGLDRHFKGSPNFARYHLPLRERLEHLLTLDPERLSAKLSLLGNLQIPVPELMDLAAEWEECLILVADAQFLQRLQTCPRVASFHLGEGAPEFLTHALDHADRVAEHLDTTWNAVYGAIGPIQSTPLPK